VNKTRTGVIAALDVGSTKVTCLIAQLHGADGIRIVGVGHHASQGVRAGAIVDMDAARTSVLTAVSAAEQRADTRIRQVMVNVSAGKPASQSRGARIAIGGSQIDDADLRRVISHGNGHDLADDQELIHCIPVGYTLDSTRGIQDPRGMFGETLGVDMHLVTARAGTMRNLATCVEGCHLDMESAVVSPYASGLACLVEDEMDLGVTLVDMGGGTTTIAVFYDGDLVHTDSIPVGGQHVTSDIARGLSTPLAQAERMKTLYGSAITSPTDEHEIIDVPLVGEDAQAQANHVPRSILIGVIRPRMEETFELVRSRLEVSGADRIAGRRLVLTGGASQLQGVRELATLILEKQVRMGRPIRFSGLAESASGPAFSTGAGLLRFAATNGGESHPDMQFLHETPGGRFGRLGQWIRENF
jgi:cell division protein FtsA